MRTQARVCAIDAAGRVDLEFHPIRGCRGCEGACQWFRQSSGSRLSLAAEAEYEVGQRVIVELPSRYVLYGSALLHGLPWLLLLAGASVGALWGGSDLSCLGGAVAGISLAAVIVRRLQPRLRSTTEHHLCVVPHP
ncbi:MAG: SoxR reducing system RseC family protein [Gammaproteobacteria bacterium]